MQRGKTGNTLKVVREQRRKKDEKQKVEIRLDFKKLECEQGEATCSQRNPHIGKNKKRESYTEQYRSLFGSNIKQINAIVCHFF